MAEIRRCPHRLGCLKISVNDGISIGSTTNLNWFIIMYPDGQKTINSLLPKSAPGHSAWYKAPVAISPCLWYRAHGLWSDWHQISRACGGGMSGWMRLMNQQKRWAAESRRDVFSGKYLFGNKTNNYPQMDGWNTSFPSVRPIFRGDLLVLVCFSECVFIVGVSHFSPRGNFCTRKVTTPRHWNWEKLKKTLPSSNFSDAHDAQPWNFMVLFSFLIIFQARNHDQDWLRWVILQQFYSCFERALKVSVELRLNPKKRSSSPMTLSHPSPKPWKATNCCLVAPEKNGELDKLLSRTLDRIIGLQPFISKMVGWGPYNPGPHVQLSFNGIWALGGKALYPFMVSEQHPSGCSANSIGWRFYGLYLE